VSLEQLPQGELTPALCRSALQEPADEDEPQAVDPIAAKDQHHSPKNKEEGHSTPDVSRKVCGLAQVVGGGPDDGAEDPAPIQRETGNQVEPREQEVYKTQPLSQCSDGMIPSSGGPPCHPKAQA